MENQFVSICMKELNEWNIDEINKMEIQNVKYKFKNQNDYDSKNICSLWAGMGHVMEIQCIIHKMIISFVIKDIQMPKSCVSIGDIRKQDSYFVEAAFYSSDLYKRVLENGCHIPKPIKILKESNHHIQIGMTKINGSSGYIGTLQARKVLEWLANFHGTFWGVEAADAAVSQGLQPQGTFWYLDTRQSEWEQIPKRGVDGRLRLAARAIDWRLRSDPHIQTVCHGDCKSSNILFDQTGVPYLVDFQYCGKAAFTKDLAYFFICACDDEDSDDELLAYYHAHLRKLVPQTPSMEYVKEMLLLAFADLARFMSGWGWWGHDLHPAVSRLLDRLDNGTKLSNEDAYRQRIEEVFPFNSQ